MPRANPPVAAKVRASAVPLERDDSPPPGPATTTLRPPGASTLGARFRLFEKAGPALRLVAGAAVVIAASIGVAYGTRHYLRSSPRFAIRTVLVEGAHRRTAEEITVAGGIAVGKNIFALDVSQAAALVTQDPWIEKADVVRKLPSTVSITVVEREAAAMVTLGGELYLTSRTGDIFKKVGERDPSDLPILTGITPTQVTKDRVHVVRTIARMLDVADELDRAGVTRRYPVQEIHVEKDSSLSVTIGREAITIDLGLPPYREKVAQAERILIELSRRKANASIIFLDNAAHPERVVVRMR